NANFPQQTAPYSFTAVILVPSSPVVSNTNCFPSKSIIQKGNLRVEPSGSVSVYCIFLSSNLNLPCEIIFPPHHICSVLSLKNWMDGSSIFRSPVEVVVGGLALGCSSFTYF